MQNSKNPLNQKIASLIAAGDHQQAVELLQPLLKAQSVDPEVWYLASLVAKDPERKKQFLERSTFLAANQATIQSDSTMEASVTVLKSDAPPRAKNLLRITSILQTLLLLIITLGLLITASASVISARIASENAKTVALMGSYTPQPTFTPRSTFTPMPTYTPFPTLTQLPTQIVSKIYSKFSYITLSYEQIQNFLEGSGYYMSGQLSEPSLDAQFFSENNTCIANTKLFSDCVKYAKPLSYYVNQLGDLGWELTGIIDKSSNISFRVELYFKRQVS